MTAQKELKKEILQTQKSILKTVADATKTAVGAPDDKADQKMKAVLSQLKQDHQEVSLKIKRKTTKGQWAFFVLLEALPLDEVAQYGVDVICQREGGDGTYLVEVIAGNAVRDQIGPIVITGGQRHEKPRALREAETQNPFGAPMGALGGGFSGPQPTGVGAAGIKDFVGYMNQSNASAQQSNDRLMSVMAQSQQMQMQAMQQQNQQQMNFIAAMIGQQNQQPQQNSEVETLKAELRAVREQQQQQQMFDSLRSEIAAMRQQQQTNQPSELATMMPLIMKSFDSGKKDDATQLAFLQMIQQSSKENQSAIWKMLELMNSKPPEDERLRGMMDTMSTGMSSMMGLFANAAQAMSAGNQGPSIGEKALDTASEVAVGLIHALGNRGESEQVETQVHQIEQPMPPVAQLPEHEEAMPMAGLEDDGSEAFDIASDPGLSQIFDLIESDGAPEEISARIWAHRKTGHRVSNGWFENPAEFGYALMQQLGISDERMDEVTRNLLRFREHLDNGGAPNAWSADTGYLPEKPKKAQTEIPEPVVEAPLPQAQQVPPEETMYNPNIPTAQQNVVHRVPGDGSMTEEESYQATLAMKQNGNVPA